MKYVQHTALLLVFMLYARYTHAQSIEKQVISSTGGLLQNGQSSVHFTSGEAVITTVSNSHTLHQGFHHPTPITIGKLSAEKNLFSCYPNPFNMGFYIQSANASAYQYHIYNMQGELISQGNAQGRQFVSMSAYANGMYRVTIVTHENTAFLHQFQITKH